MKIKIFMFLVLLSAIGSSLSLSATTNTDITYDNKLTSGVNISYWIDPSNEYTVSIPEAVHSLMYPSGMTNPIVLSSTTNYNSAKMDFYEYRTADGINAKTSVFRKNSAGDYYNSTSQMDTYDWVYGDIKINDYYMNGYGSVKRENVLIHEMGHVYGCKDINNVNSIMHYSSGWSSSVKGLTSDANKVLNDKY